MKQQLNSRKSTFWYALPMLLLNDLFPYILPLYLENPRFNAFFSHDVAKAAQLPFSYCVSEEECGANVLQHPLVGSFIFMDTMRNLLQHHNSKTLILLLSLFVGTHDSQTYVEIEENSCSKKSGLEISRLASTCPYVQYILMVVLWIASLILNNSPFLYSASSLQRAFGHCHCNHQEIIRIISLHLGVQPANVRNLSGHLIVTSP